MTSAGSRLDLPTAGRVLWITGLAGSGKTTLSRLVVDALRARGISPLLLDGDGVRKALAGSFGDNSDSAGVHAGDSDGVRAGDSAGDAGNGDPAHHGYDLESRARRAWRLARLARLAALQGIPVVVATISLFHQIQAWNRNGPVPYAEIVLDAPLALLRQRMPDLYQPGAASDVVGIDLPAEFPQQPELVLAQEFASWELPNHLSKVLTLWDSMPM